MRWKSWHIDKGLMQISAMETDFANKGWDLSWLRWVTLSSSVVVNDIWLENVAPPTAYLDELTPNICIAVVDGDTHKSAFSFAKLLKIQKKFQDIWMETQRTALNLLRLSVSTPSVTAGLLTRMLSAFAESLSVGLLFIVTLYKSRL